MWPPEINQALQELGKLAQDPKYRAQYEQYEERRDYLLSQQAMLDAAYQEGRLDQLRSLLDLPRLSPAGALSAEDAQRMADKLEQEVRAKFPKD